ncbi:MAG: TonB-dependent receptor [Lysobacteraceae bacterium]|nr:MAG: TonB-dependent receptor [Xanthomonadaceae bacterium]
MQLTTVFLALSSSWAAADTSEVATQPPITVTATRTEQAITDTLAAVSIIDRDRIDQSVAQDLVDLLRLEPGVDIVRSGGSGGQTSVFLRGTNSNHVLVLIDGVRVASTLTGAFNWENLPVAQIERVEIVRGPRASYYGSDAIGGVIEVTTRQAENFGARAQLGSFDTVRGSTWFGAGDDSNHFSTALSYANVGGFSSQNSGGFSYDADDDGYRNRALSTRFANQVSDSQTLSGSILYSNGRNEFDQGVSDQVNKVAGVALSGNLAAQWNHRLSLGYAAGDLETPVFGSDVSSSRTTLDWLLSTDRQWGALTVGINWMDERGRENDTFTAATVYSVDRNNVGLFGAYQRHLGQHQVELSARYDDNSEFGDHLTGQAAWGYHFSNQLNAFASVGTAFRSPSLSEQFSPGFFGLFAGNPNLDPERSTSAELGLRWANDSQSVSGNIFHSDIKDLIAFSGVDFQAININKAQIQGLELDWQSRFGAYVSRVALTVQDTENKATGAELVRRPKSKAAATLSRQFALGELGAELLYVGKRDEIFGGELGDYTVLNLTGQWSFARHWQLEGRVENLFDESYEVAAGFNTPERSAWLGVVFSQ